MTQAEIQSFAMEVARPGQELASGRAADPGAGGEETHAGLGLDLDEEPGSPPVAPVAPVARASGAGSSNDVVSPAASAAAPLEEASWAAAAAAPVTAGVEVEEPWRGRRLVREGRRYPQVRSATGQVLGELQVVRLSRPFQRVAICQHGNHRGRCMIWRAWKVKREQPSNVEAVLVQWLIDGQETPSTAAHQAFPRG